MSVGCCALGTCEDPLCDLCQRVAKLPQPPRLVDKGKFAEPGSGERPSRDPSKIKRHRKVIAGTLRVRVD